MTHWQRRLIWSEWVGELRAEMGEMRGEIKALRILMMSAIGVMGLALAGLNVILQLAG